jgi:acetoin utilization deacetylase AcuC-like enzyme
LPAGSDGAFALQTWDARAAPAIEAFQPEFLLISAGFDALASDPLGGLNWDAGTFAALTRRCVSLADRFCQGRIVSVLEGGYDPNGLARAAVAHVEALR